MFSKFTEKASSYASTAAAAANATYETGKQGLSSVPCDRCGVPHNALLRLSTCPVCGGRVCKGCSAQLVVPDACAKSGAGSSGEVSVCARECGPRCGEANAAAFRRALAASHAANVTAFLEDLASGRAAGETYPRPGAAVADTGASATAMRLAPLALEALKLSGYSDVVRAYQLAEGGIAAVLLTPTFRIFAERVLPMLRRHVRDAGEATSYKTRGAAEAELALRLYYLACGDAVGRLRACGAPREATRRGPAASDDVLDALGYWIGPAQWLYAANELRKPQHTPDWAAWYCKKLCETSGGWRLLACVGASRSENARCSVPSLPKVRFPAWCLAARGDEAVLAIRGSQTPGDWAINSDADEAPVFGVDSAWVAHGGILRAARAILNDCGAGEAVDALRARGVRVTCVGHSLGGGVAALVATLLNDHGALPRVRCYAFATPACVSADLAAFLKPTVTSCVLQDDVVPRLSDATCARLAADLVNDDANYRASFAKDRAAYAGHVATLGKGEGMVHDAREDALPLESLDRRAASPTLSGRKSAAARLVVPGLVVFLAGVDGNYEAHATDGDLPELNKVQLTPRAVNDHDVSQTAFALRVVRATRSRRPRERPAPPFRPALLADNTWAPCAVCGSDVTWTSAVRGSDAARASATHHCRACGALVCAFCAPAGDRVAGDGIAQFTELPDKRVTIPSMGCLGRVRVCRPCGFNAYNL
ncbi:diacylglycerol lipase [Aureococcus anophagefferens]|uniref:sn-1-specific diacylglycerol lipase n=3 Tax=Aureococcus anophagefferens TaxID=44056 RepID=F0XZW6_AURAN|nr:hypothetical protein AURANDRAFT_70934 [Aureococcus anophagefferens]EGB11412.1 hypothetical protein AURANDRAFT_70934 [Aureococcus anophagefferens]|mmetsp:Transcript_5336/g.16949  ORF Transcript_5336/g.16949 Transcript_5336/m.16949 type:complete len:711 (+) Transcript_5336:192-2324(+)|eukprot:XP_009033782.1 hypothetical protein AURANDRAFT_70934 [Aureococcus anophagefferens]